MPFLKKMYFLIEEYLPIFFIFIVSISLALIILGASFFLGNHKPDSQKVSAYECGFNPYEDSRNKFEIRFYILAILFIIFDLEAIFIFPWSIVLGQITSFGFWTMFDFLFELLVGFIYIWKIGALEWQ